MDLHLYLLSLRNALGFKLLVVGRTAVTTGTLILILFIIAATFLISRLAQKGLQRLLVRGGIEREATLQLARRLAHYTILLGGMVAALQTVGIDLSTLFAAGAVFAVGIGFAMRNIAENFVSGVILLVERTIKPGDILEIDGEVVRVERMGIRSTLARTREEEELIIPNAILAQGMVKNYTLSDSLFLLRGEVGVVYGSDMKVVKETLMKAAQSITWRDQNKEPRVLLTGFGDSSVNFAVFVWISDPWFSRRLASDLNETIWWALKDAGITIAFPQLDVHFDPPAQP